MEVEVTTMISEYMKGWNFIIKKPNGECLVSKEEYSTPMMAQEEGEKSLEKLGYTLRNVGEVNESN